MDPPDELLRLHPWYVTAADGSQTHRLEVTYARAHKQQWLVGFKGFEDRDQAESLPGSRIEIDYALLPQPAEGEHYWVDLIGLAVTTTEGVCLGQVDRLFETGANDVLVVIEQASSKERLLPYTDQVVVKVDLDARQVTVDWDPDF
jgi:16S rRNA processing protein RimM